MRTRIIRIGNSRGIRLAKPLLEQAGISDEVDIRVEPGAVIITAAVSPRAGWAEAAAGVKTRSGRGRRRDSPRRGLPREAESDAGPGDPQDVPLRHRLAGRAQREHGTFIVAP
jgi:antitoxin MazE